jgi:hypothetical protein
MKEKYAYINFEGYKSINDLKKFISKRIYELKLQGFDKKQILKIVFEDSHFKECFISNQLWKQLKDEFIKFNNNENISKN